MARAHPRVANITLSQTSPQHRRAAQHAFPMLTKQEHPRTHRSDAQATNAQPTLQKRAPLQKNSHKPTHDNPQPLRSSAPALCFAPDTHGQRIPTHRCYNTPQSSAAPRAPSGHLRTHPRHTSASTSKNTYPTALHLPQCERTLRARNRETVTIHAQKPNCDPSRAAAAIFLEQPRHDDDVG